MMLSINQTTQALSRRATRLLAVALVAVVAYMAGATSRPAHQAHAEVRGKPAPHAFKSGGERSARLLNEISATLHVMDGRLQNIERAAMQSTKE